MNMCLKYRIILVTIISSWILFFPAYVHYYNLTEADSLHNPHWENPFQEGLLAGLSKKWEIPELTTCSLMFDRDSGFFEFIRHVSLLEFSPTNQILFMRC